MWGIELWDQFENVDKHHQHGIEFTRKYSKFVKERCALELEYASKLKKLVKAHQPKKRDEGRSMFSTHKAFQSQLSELNDIAGQHEVIAEEMVANIYKVLTAFCVEMETAKKSFYHDGRRQQAELDQQEKSLEHIKRKFEKEWKECEKAQLSFDKFDNDLNATKIDVEKARNIWTAKKDAVESCKADYASALQMFNKMQVDHYTVHMPKIFQAYKDADKKQTMKSREMMMEFSKIDMKVQPLIQKCLEGMEKAAGAIDAELDAQLVIDKLKSGFSIPSDKEFEDFTQLSSQRSTTDGVDNAQRHSSTSARPAKTKALSWLFNKQKHPKEMRERSSTTQSSSTASDSGLDQEENSEKVNNEKNGGGSKTDTNPPKARTLSAMSAKTFSIGISSGRTSEKISSSNRSSSMDILNKSEATPGELVPRKSSKAKSRHLDFRKSIPVNKQKIKAMFRSNKEEELAPKIEVSGPITCDLMGTSANDDYLVPITSPTEEHPYDEVALSRTEDNSVAPETADYSHLPPEQRRRKLQKSIEDLKKDISKEEEGRKAIMKMEEVYRSNPAMGDSASLTSQLSASKLKIDKMYTELAQLESWYASAGGTATSDRQSLAQRPVPARPDQSPSQNAVQPQVTQRDSSSKLLQRTQSFGDDFDEEPEPIGTCVALYDFEPTSDSALPMKCGEKFSVIEADSGDGWTRAMRDGVDGYVPTTYIEIEFFT